MPPRIPDLVRQMVRRRASFLCEYCHTPETWQLIEFTIDHVIPKSLGGSDDPDNLALACFHCNRRKSNSIVVRDKTTDSEIPLFDPRKMIWQEHFIWSADLLYLEALTEVGAATIEQLSLNRDRLTHLRYLDLLVNRHPPIDDPHRSPQTPLN